MKQDEEYSELKQTKEGVPKGSVLGPVLYLLFTHEIPINVNIATFTDDTAILAIEGANADKAIEKLQATN